MPDLSCETIASVTECPLANVSLYWPKIVTCLKSLNLWSPQCEVAALATIVVETAHTFKPVHEYGGEEYLDKMYDTRTDLGNTPEHDGDGALYCGRGFAQLTGKKNYELAGQALGIDLVHNPQRAMLPDEASAIFAWFFQQKHIDVVANHGDWEHVRRRWNGGLNGYPDFMHQVMSLQKAQQGIIH